MVESLLEFLTWGKRESLCNHWRGRTWSELLLTDGSSAWSGQVCNTIPQGYWWGMLNNHISFMRRNWEAWDCLACRRLRGNLSNALKSQVSGARFFLVVPVKSTGSNRHKLEHRKESSIWTWWKTLLWEWQSTVTGCPQLVEYPLEILRTNPDAFLCNLL